MGKWDGKVAIITGAAQRMGAMHPRFVEEVAKDFHLNTAQQLADETGKNSKH